MFYKFLEHLKLGAAVKFPVVCVISADVLFVVKHATAVASNRRASIAQGLVLMHRYLGLY